MQQHIFDQLRRSYVNNKLWNTFGDLQNGGSTCATLHDLFNTSMFTSLSHISLQKDEVLVNICASADASFSRFSPNEGAALCSSMLKIFHTIMGKIKLSDLIASNDITDSSSKAMTMMSSCDFETSIAAASAANTISNSTTCGCTVN